MRIFVASPGHIKTAPMGYYCAETLRGLGHDVSLFDSGSLTLSEKILLRPIAKLSRKKGFEKNKLNERLLKAVEKFKPDLFLSIFGFDLFPETLEKIRGKKILTACWWLNDPFQFDRALKLAPSYDFFFSNCETSAQRYRQNGISSAQYLPHAAFTPLHRPINLNERERKTWQSEVCFVGDWGPVRQGILSMLSQKVDLRIWGPWKKHLTPKDRLWSRVTDGYFSTDDMAKAFSAAKIVVNLHSWFGYYDYGLNPRVFEAPACGTIQLCDWKLELGKHFKEGEEVVTYRTGIELETKIKDLLENAHSRETIQQAALKRVAADHTYPHRMKQMLELVKL
jgi:spore maturation protein CgeB